MVERETLRRRCDRIWRLLYLDKLEFYSMFQIICFQKQNDLCQHYLLAVEKKGQSSRQIILFNTVSNNK
jgi:hypothetical protein